MIKVQTRQVEMSEDNMPWPMPDWPKVLLIDNEPNTAYIILRDLHADKINVLMEETLEAGFARALKVKPDLIVVDYKFNGDDGITFAKKLREEPRLASIPRILITERELDHALHMRALAEGYMGCIQKPKFDRSWAQLFRSFMR